MAGWSATIWFLLAITVFMSESNEASDEHKLIKSLLKNYKKAGIKNGRPLVNHYDTLNVSMGIDLIRVELDTEKNQLMADMWISYRWTDHYLQWESNNISLIRVSIDDIWKPDIKLYNEAEPLNMRDELVMVSDGGDVFWVPRARAVVDCILHNNDTYMCPMKFASWTYNGFELDLQYIGVDGARLQNYAKFKTLNPVVNFFQRNVVYYPCCPEPFIDITLNLGFVKKEEDSWWG